MTMLRKKVQSSYFRDPYLYAMWREAGSPEEVKDPWFYGYSTTPRWMQLIRSGVELRSVTSGIAIRSGDPALDDALEELVGSRNDVSLVEDGYLLAISQELVDGRETDRHDRVQVGAALISELIAAGL